MACPVCNSGAEETPSHFLKECHGLCGIRENHEVKEEDKIQELLLFCDREKRKKYLGDLWRERARQVQLGYCLLFPVLPLLRHSETEGP